MTKQELIKKMAHTLTYQGWDGCQSVHRGEEQTGNEGGYKMTKNVECPYCHVREDRQVVETGQVSVGKPMQMYKFKCDGCGRYFWKHEKVQR